MIKNLTCIVCPIGCKLEVELDDGGNVKSVSGNTCKRGEEYAKSEMTHPTRIITTTVRVANGQMVSVKTHKPILKEKMFDCMKIINKLNPPLPIRVGDVIIEDVFGSNIVATQNAQ